MIQLAIVSRKSTSATADANPQAIELSSSSKKKGRHQIVTKYTYREIITTKFFTWYVQELRTQPKLPLLLPPPDLKRRIGLLRKELPDGIPMLSYGMFSSEMTPKALAEEKSREAANAALRLELIDLIEKSQCKKAYEFQAWLSENKPEMQVSYAYISCLFRLGPLLTLRELCCNAVFRNQYGRDPV